MNEFLKKILAKAAGFWADWSMRQRVIFLAVIVAVVVGIVMLFRVSATPVMASVIDAPIRDEEVLDRILVRLNEEGVNVTVTPNGIVQVADQTTARRMRTILIREDLIPSNIDPWKIFDKERWTITDLERKINLQRAQQQMIVEHIKSIEGVDNTRVSIVWPAKELFQSEQNPVSASVVIFPTPGSDITKNRKKIEGIQKLLKLAIEGLKDENIAITDNYANVINDFEGMAESDRLSNIVRESKIVQDDEKIYRTRILSQLQSTFTSNRVRDLNIKIDKDMSKKSVDTTEYFPVIIKPPTPGLPYDDSVRRESVLRSESVSETTWKGTGQNPEGPSGVEGQTPPAFKDMSNLYGEMTQTTRTHNEDINETKTKEERSPKQMERVTVSVNIDGTWKLKHDEKGSLVVLPDNTLEREYIPVPDDDLRKAERIIRDAIGYNSARGDSVTVTNIAFDRTEEFKLEDAAYFRKKQIQTTVIVFLSGLTLLLFGFILFRMISREMERRRRLAEEERARREQMLRESAMAAAEQEGMEVSISLEERNRMELMESVINMAKEHPDDAAQLIRTWLLEE
ncbi:MAG: flagellar M-ring protein FliF [Treponema sp.]|jgi:flagellar M-ring protein FliF|nr:flagellar M-ring protein FliF [Treponema sp.]